MPLSAFTSECKSFIFSFLWEDQDYFAEFLALKVQILFTE